MIYNLSLNAHESKYDLSGGEIALSLFTLTGIPYALRHKELSMEPTTSNPLGHKVLRIVQMIPIIGALAAIIDYVASKIFASPSVKVQESDDPLEKLKKEFKKVESSLNEKSGRGSVIFTRLTGLVGEAAFEEKIRLRSELAEIIAETEYTLYIYSHSYPQYLDGDFEGYNQTEKDRLVYDFMQEIYNYTYEFKNLKEALNF